MRTILFRGKAIEPSLGWIYGDLIQISNSYPDIQRYNKTIEVKGEKCKSYELDKVSPDTVGQFTGMYDGNGKEIFEGDILQYRDEDGKVYNREVVFNDGAFCQKIVPATKPYFTPLRNHELEDWEVIGNIHDNPELLEGGAK